MRAALLLVIVACSALAEPPPRYRLGDRYARARISRCDLLPALCAVAPDPFVPHDFDFNPRTGEGVPTTAGCYASTEIVGMVAGALTAVSTFARTGTAEVYSADGQTLTQCSSGQVRVSTGAINTARMAPWVEPESAQNLLRYSRDFSQVSNWTATNMTCTLTATGMRGAANTASHCVATAANATVCQTITTASALRNTNGHIKRSIGTGAITLTRNGSTYLADVASQLSLTRWKRAVSYDATGCAGGDCIVQQGLASTVLNPQICLKIATSGDAVDLDFWQDEAGARPSSPIENASTTQNTRNGETLYFTTPGISVRSLAVSFQANGLPGSFYAPIGAWQNSTNVLSAWTDSNPGMTCVNYHSGSLTQYATFFFAPISASSFTQWDCDFGASAQVAYQRGIPYSQASGGHAVPLVTRIYVGSSPIAGTVGMPGMVRDVCAGDTEGDCTSGLRYTSEGNPIAVNGDSITLGVQQLPTRWAQDLNLRQNRAVFNIGNTGLSAAVCLDNYRNYVRGRGYTSMTVLCGVNSLIAGDSAATTFASLQTLFDEARAEGLRLTIGTLTPWAESPLSDAAKQVQTLALNASLSSYCTANGVTCVDFYNSVLNDGTGKLAAPYADPDKLHPNAAGGAAMGILWNAAAP